MFVFIAGTPHGWSNNKSEIKLPPRTGSVSFGTIRGAAVSASITPRVASLYRRQGNFHIHCLGLLSLIFSIGCLTSHTQTIK